MKPVFADTFYYLALLNPSDQFHEEAAAAARGMMRRVVTTAWVLTEIGDGLAATGNRRLFGDFVRAIRSDRRTRLIGFSSSVFDAAVELYRERPDKSWSLTDCTSFKIMSRLGLREALTGDRHFEQAGFSALFR